VSRVLLDTNILVYAYDRSEEVKRGRAVALLAALQERHEILLSAQVLGEFFWVSTRKLAAPLLAHEAEQLLIDFSQAWSIVPVTWGVVGGAARGVIEHGLSYWDAQLWAVAHQNDIAFILTEDMQDGRSVEGVQIRNPLREGFDAGQLRVGVG
jgi:predicted nucleic acid-binding protein